MDSILHLLMFRHNVFRSQLPGAKDIVNIRYRKGLSGVHEVVTSLSNFQKPSLHVPPLQSSSDIYMAKLPKWCCPPFHSTVSPLSQPTSMNGKEDT